MSKGIETAAFIGIGLAGVFVAMSHPSDVAEPSNPPVVVAESGAKLQTAVAMRDETPEPTPAAPTEHCNCDPCECDPCECGPESEEPATINWAEDYRSGLAAAREASKPLLVLFTRSVPPCRPCKTLEAGALSDERVIEYLNREAVCVRFDVSQDGRPPFRVESVPLLWVREPGRNGRLARPKQDAGEFLRQVKTMTTR